MLIGLMADSHDRVPAIRELLERMSEHGAGMVLHAGDYCSPFSLAPFLEMSIPFAGVFGRNDGDREGLKAFAARGMGMTSSQVLWSAELPLAFPVILTGIRIVLVQNIGLATIAALIGGGGFGVFVFQGIGQTAMDLVLLGAVPTVALAFAAAVVLDAATELSNSKPGRAA